MSNTAIDLTLGLNLQIGSVPVSLSAEVESKSSGSVYTFSGSVQDATIDIGKFMSYIGQQFGVDVQFPPELNLEAIIDYVAGQITYTKPVTGATTTEMGMAAKFELVYQNGSSTETFGFSFYADTILTSGSATSNYVVGASIDSNLAFKDLPLVGSIPVFNEYTLQHLGFSYTNADPAQNNGKPVSFNIPQVSQSSNPLKPAGSPPSRESNTYAIDTKGDQTTFSLNKKGFAFTAGLLREGSNTAVSNFSLPMALPAAPVSTAPATYYQGSGSGSVKASPPASPINWININKTFGPVDLQKIGLNYKSGEATFGLSAGFSMGGFSLDLQGLSITFPLPLPGMPAGNTVSFDLDGLAMDFQRGNLRLGGAFLKVKQNDITNYFGEVVVQVASYGFKAIGGYAPAQNNNPASFFIYANLQVPLGGPPFLYVSGLAFGFGVNYALNLPTIATLPGYLLLPGKAPAQPSNAGAAFSSVLTQLASGTNPVVTRLAAVPEAEGGAVVTLALDGENPWEHYPRSGEAFLEALYSRLSDPACEVRSVLPREELLRAPATRAITRLHSGSWIDSSYRIWIGHPEDNEAWTQLSLARAALAEEEKRNVLSQDTLDRAREILLPAQGSDWFWWYGDDFETENAVEFDALFRRRIAATFRALQRPVPERVTRPIIAPHKDKAGTRDVRAEPSRLIRPVIDGWARSFFEWQGAGSWRPGRSIGGAMHQGRACVAQMLYGFSLEDFYLRIDPDPQGPQTPDSLLLVLRRKDRPGEAAGSEVETRLSMRCITAGPPEPVRDAGGAVCGRGQSGAIVELSVRLEALGLHTADRLMLEVHLLRDGVELERMPRAGGISLLVPDRAFEQAHWQV